MWNWTKGDLRKVVEQSNQGNLWKKKVGVNKLTLQITDNKSEGAGNPKDLTNMLKEFLQR